MTIHFADVSVKNSYIDTIYAQYGGVWEEVPDIMVNGKWKPLTDLIASEKISTALPQTYEVSIEAPVGLTAVQLVDYDLAGRVESFGSFYLGGVYGEFQSVERVDWEGPRAERDSRLRQMGFSDTARTWGSSYRQRHAHADGAAPQPTRWKP